jgi:ketosteroid isomerase-like protein
LILVVLATFRERTEAKDEVIGTLYGQDWLAMPEEALERALVELLDPDVVFVGESEAGAPPSRHVGIAEALRLFGAARGDWARYRYIVEGTDEQDGEVLVSGRVVAEIRESGDRASFRFAHLWTIRDERAIKVVAYHGPAEARAALKRPTGSW